MRMNTLGKTDIEVSALCLGSMTWGTQTTAEEAHIQIDRAMEAGVNFIDTAEMYPVNPVREETVGRTERIIGLWLEARNRRDDIVIATKHSGEGLMHVRGGAPIGPDTIGPAVEGSLRRIKTDYIDLYQFHWPNRGSYMFRKNWSYVPSHQDPASIRQEMDDCLGALQKQVDMGRIRAFGLSNESAWGTAQWLASADRTGGMRVASIQNEYSLLCRLYDTDLAELSIMEEVGLLSYSPLAAGLLTGKYQDSSVPDGSRMTLNPDLGGRKTPRVFKAVDAYIKIALKYGLDPVQMSLSWCMSRPFMCSTIFGATNTAQLDRALGAAKLRVEPDVAKEIDSVHRQFPMPF